MIYNESCSNTKYSVSTNLYNNFVPGSALLTKFWLYILVLMSVNKIQIITISQQVLLIHESWMLRTWMYCAWVDIESLIYSVINKK